MHLSTEPADAIHSWSRLFSQYPPAPGDADLLVMGLANAPRLAGGFMATLANARRADTGARIAVVVVLAAQQSTSDFEERMISFAADCIYPHVGIYNLSPVLDALFDDEHVLHCDASAHAVCEVLRSIESDALVLVPDVSALLPAFQIGDLDNIDEYVDAWTTALGHILARVKGQAVAGKHYVLMGVPDFIPPSDAAEVLYSIEGAGIFTAEKPSNEEILSTQIERWVGAASAGATLHACGEVARSLGGVQRTVTIAECLMVGNRRALAKRQLELARAALLASADARLLTRAAGVSSGSGDRQGVRQYLTRAQSFGLGAAEVFQAAIAHAEGADDDGLSVGLWASFAATHPSHPDVIEYRFARADTEQEYRDVAAAADSAGHGYFALAAREFSNSRPNYQGLVDAVSFRMPEERPRALRDAVMHSISRQRLRVAHELVVRADWSSHPHVGAELAARCMEALFLSRGDANSELASEEEQRAVDELLACGCALVASNPTAAKARRALLRALSHSVAGVRGVLHLVHRLLQTQPPAVRPVPQAAASPMPLDDLGPIIARAMPEIPKPFLIGVGRLPELGPYKPGQLLDRIAGMIQSALDEHGTSGADAGVFLMLVHLAALAAEATGDPESDLDIRSMGAVAGGFATAGDYQRARDLAEHALLLGSSVRSETRLRAAWITYADVHERCDNLVEALVAFVCSRGFTASYRDVHAFLADATTAVRCLRSVHAYSSALALLRQTVDALGDGIEPWLRRRLEALAVSVELQELVAQANTPEAAERLAGLIARTVEIVEEADEGEELAPPLSLLANGIGALHAIGQSPEPRAIEALNRGLDRVGSATAKRLRLTASARVSVDDVLELTAELAATRDSIDLASDLRLPRLVARRALRTTEDPGELALLLDLLSDQSVDVPPAPDREDASTVADALSDLAATELARRSIGVGLDHELAMAEDLRAAIAGHSAGATRLWDPAALQSIVGRVAQEGWEVALLGLDDRSELTTVSSSLGTLRTGRQPCDVFAIERFQEWADKYPARYGAFDSNSSSGLTDVEQTLDGLAIKLPSSDAPVIFVRPALLASLPPNLMPVNGELAGRVRPVAAVPSLSWLAQAVTNPCQASGRRAWIPVGDNNATLARLLDAVGDSLEEHGFQVSTSSQPPAMESVEIAVIGAHGGLQAGNRSFRVLADESTTRLSASSIAGRVAGSAIVIVLVCSGGRMDATPFGAGSTGLARELLHRGCSTVLASPWPLEVQAARRWLPVFLAEMDAGEQAGLANFKACRAVGEQTSGHPMLGLAMNLLGNPLVRLPVPSSSGATECHSGRVHSDDGHLAREME